MKKILKIVIALLVAILLASTTAVYADTPASGYQQNDNGSYTVYNKEGLDNLLKDHPDVSQTNINAYYQYDSGYTDIENAFAQKNSGSGNGGSTSQDPGYTVGNDGKIYAHTKEGVDNALRDYPDITKDQLWIEATDVSQTSTLSEYRNQQITTRDTSRGYYVDSNGKIHVTSERGVTEAASKYPNVGKDQYVVETDSIATYDTIKEAIDKKVPATTTTPTDTSTTTTQTNTPSVTKSDIDKKKQRISELEAALEQAFKNGGQTDQIARDLAAERQELQRLERIYEESGQKAVDEAQDDVDYWEDQVKNAKTEEEKKKAEEELQKAKDRLADAQNNYNNTNVPTANLGDLGQIYTSSDATLNNMGGLVIGVVTFVCYAAAIIILLVKGVQFMMAAPEGKAELKKQLVAYVIGAVIMFAIGTFVQIIATVAHDYIGGIT